MKRWMYIDISANIKEQHYLTKLDKDEWQKHTNNSNI